MAAIPQMMRTATNLLSRATPHLTNLAQAAGAAATLHAAVSGGGQARTAPEQAAPPPRFRQCARSQQLQRQFRGEQAARGARSEAGRADEPADPVKGELKRMSDEAQERAEATVEAAKSVG
ncbi:hypothetical protein SOM61_22645 [Massilia sp. CFBP9012]|uniref:hypothetical protein n=1 Tax=Massilia sp. CFBP9012 TaxID=3096531 RepID=UPI002A69DD13|nr:hypothetical protein [Massilia sp. CFBP9012]MDY0977766.1 hypothetical protein [Massilia sp. CFBP9012]